MCENLEKNSSFEITNDSFESRVVLLSNKDKKLNPKIDFGF
jgi:tRNA wybutosine-synthesizing protein 1